MSENMTEHDIHDKLSTACLSDAPEEPLNQLFSDCISRGNLDAFNRATESILRSSPSFNPLETIAMTIVPRLLDEVPTRDPTVERLWMLIGDHGSAKEIIVAVNEALERIIQCAEDDENEIDYAFHLQMLIDLYTSALKRMTVRRRPVSDILDSVLSDVLRAWKAVISETTQAVAHSLLSSTFRCIRTSWNWVESTSPDSLEKIKCRGILGNLILRTLAMSSQYLKTSVATTIYETRFPELIIPGRKYIPSKSEVDAKELILAALDISEAIGFDYNLRLQAVQTADADEALGSIILLAHDSKFPVAAHEALLTGLPVLVSSLSSNVAISEAFAYLLQCLYNIDLSVHLSEDLVVSLISCLNPVSSLHPSPNFRKIGFSLMSRLIYLSDPFTQKQILFELLAECPFPQMRVAAIQLLKKCILETLEGGNGLPLSTYAEFSPVLLNADPPELLQDQEHLLSAAFFESSEPARLTQSLGLYYVLLKRDHDNQTGVRDLHHREVTESRLLNPLRHAIANWKPRVHDSPRYTHALFPLITAMDRVDEALNSL